MDLLLPHRLNRKRARSFSAAGDTCIDNMEDKTRLRANHYVSDKIREDGHDFLDCKRRCWSVKISIAYVNTPDWNVRHVQDLSPGSPIIEWRKRRLIASRSFRTLLGLERKMLTEQLRIFE
jgi:hypothetical protein